MRRRTTFAAAAGEVPSSGQQRRRAASAQALAGKRLITCSVPTDDLTDVRGRRIIRPAV
jgi:hypothetical protein